jgi:NAD(P)-dependent dehydrogenase (short-subunit alcohol dehydrogenase family)
VYASVRSVGDAPAGTAELVFDVTDGGAVAAAASAVPSIDALVANAGIAIAAPLEFLPPAELQRQLDVNVVGQVRVVQAFLPALRRARGRIVLMGSIGGKSALPFLGAYAMSKFALEAMADSLRLEVEQWGIRVVLIEPGSIATPMWTKPQPLADAMPPDGVELYGERLRRFAARAAQRSSKGVPASMVADTVEEALASAKPRPRYVVGPDAKRRALVQQLPTRLRDRLLSKYLFGS